MQSGHELVYEYLRQCIHFEYYRYGELLPSVESLCETFTASDQTVKAALRRLDAEGYLSVGKGRRARVIYQQDETQRDTYIMRYLSQRWPAYAEMFQVSEILFRTILMEGFRRVDEDGYAALSRFAEQGDLDSLILFYRDILQGVNNPLIMNLFWEIALFLGLPYLRKCTSSNYHADEVGRQLQGFIRMGRARQWDLLDAELLAFWKKTTGSIVRSIQPYIQPVPDGETVPFVWRIYRGRPQICYSLTIRIMHDIFQGCYQECQFLPSYEKMAEQYGVSTNTIRRTVRLLTQLGVAQSINGKGTRICPSGEQSQPDLTVPALRRNLALLDRSFELLLYSCESTVYVILSSMGSDERLELIEQLKGLTQNGGCGFTPWLLLLTFAKQAPMKGLREVYAKIYGLSLWGYPLKMSGGQFPDFEGTVRTLTEAMIENLENGKIEQCAAAFKEYAVQEYPATRRYLLALGVELDVQIFPIPAKREGSG